MKKWMCCVLVGILLLCCTACNSKSDVLLASGEYNDRQIAVKSHVYTELTPVGLYGFTHNRIIMVDQEGFYPVDIKGTRLGQSTYDLLYCYNEEGRALAKTSNGEWFWLDTTGTVIESASAPESTHNSTTELYDSSETTGVTGEDGSWLLGVKDSTSNEHITAPIFEWVSSVSDALNYAVLAQGEHRNVMISPQGKIMITLPDDCTFAFLRDEHIICMSQNGKYRLADSKGQLLSEAIFNSISPFSEGLAVITCGTKLGLIATDGTIVVDPQINTDLAVNQATPYIWNNYIAHITDGNLAILKIEK